MNNLEMLHESMGIISRPFLIQHTLNLTSKLYIYHSKETSGGGGDYSRWNGVLVVVKKHKPKILALPFCY